MLVNTENICAAILGMIANRQALNKSIEETHISDEVVKVIRNSSPLRAAREISFSELSRNAVDVSAWRGNTERPDAGDYNILAEVKFSRQNYPPVRHLKKDLLNDVVRLAAYDAFTKKRACHSLQIAAFDISAFVGLIPTCNRGLVSLDSALEDGSRYQQKHIWKGFVHAFGLDDFKSAQALIAAGLNDKNQDVFLSESFETNFKAWYEQTLKENFATDWSTLKKKRSQSDAKGDIHNIITETKNEQYKQIFALNENNKTQPSTISIIPVAWGVTNNLGNNYERRGMRFSPDDYIVMMFRVRAK